MKALMVAPVGDNVETLFIGIRDFPTERVILITPKSYLKDAELAAKELDKFKIPAKIILIEGNVWEEMFKKISEIKRAEPNREIIVHTATGDRMTTCAATSAAFVNGLKAISVTGNESMLLPVLKFSYYKMLTDRKLAILKTLYNKEMFLDDLSKKTRMSSPLISYHINGNLKSEGLVTLGLVEVMEEKGRVKASLTLLGRLLIKGYIQPDKRK